VTARAIIVALAVFIGTCAAPAQGEPQRLAERRGPPEKISPRPVQPSAQGLSSPATAATVYSPWTKFCGSDASDPQAGSVCLTVKEARLETGQFVAGAALMERAGDKKKLLRFSLPPGTRLMPGARVFIDDEAMRTVPPLQCMAKVCFTGFEVTSDIVARLKQGNQLKLVGIDSPSRTASWPLAEFADALEGAPTDPKQFEEKRRWEERSRNPTGSSR